MKMVRCANCFARDSDFSPVRCIRRNLRMEDRDRLPSPRENELEGRLDYDDLGPSDLDMPMDGAYASVRFERAGTYRSFQAAL